jgi:hypothetical protein
MNVRGSVINTPVVPNSHIILIPLEAHLNIMVMRQQIEEVVQNELTFVLGHAIDMIHMMAHSKDGFPPSNRIRPDDLRQSPYRTVATG